MSAWKAEVNDTSLSQSAQVKITGLGITVKILLRSRKVSGENEFEINQPTVSQGLGNTFQVEKKLQELSKKLILNITEV